MTGRGQLYLRVQAVIDRYVWGFSDLRRVLVEYGIWPAPTQRAVSSNGDRWSIIGSALRKSSAGRKPNSLLMDEKECLWGELLLPYMPRQSLDRAVDEALWRVSPLPTDQIVAAWHAEPHAEGGWAIQWGMCRRSAQDELLTQHGLTENALVYLTRQGRAFSVSGKARQKQDSRQRWVDRTVIGALLILLIALSLPALMPLVLKRQAVVRAVQHVAALESKAAPLRQKMDELRRQAGVAQELNRNISTDLPLANVVDELSAAIPSDTWLDRIEINGSEIRIAGLTNNATELIGHLGRQAMFADVRATTANVRDGTLNKERFTFDMRWRGEGAKP